jgi:hypothetical protein
MSRVNVILAVPGLPAGALVPVELHNLRTHHSVRTVVPIDDFTAVQVDPGPLYIQAVLSDGRLLTSDVEVRGTVTVVLTPSPGPPSPPVIGAGVGQAGRYERGTPGGAAPAGSDADDGWLEDDADRAPERPYRSAWARMWEHTGEHWQPVEFHPDGVRVDGYGMHWRITQGPRGVCALQVGGDEIPHRTTILPPDPPWVVTLARSAEAIRGDFGGGYRLTVRTTNEGAEALLAYTTAGHLLAAETIAADYLDIAESMLYRKQSDPFGAIVGGYFLLRTRAVARMHDWPRNLAAWFPWLPDAIVVRIGQILLSPDPSRDELRELIGRATRAGLPAYTEGLRWLYRATELLLAEQPGDTELDTVHEALRRYADVVDWDAVLTSFRGDPVQPTVRKRTGTDVGLPFARFLNG